MSWAAVEHPLFALVASTLNPQPLIAEALSSRSLGTEESAEALSRSHYASVKDPLLSGLNTLPPNAPTD